MLCADDPSNHVPATMNPRASQTIEPTRARGSTAGLRIERAFAPVVAVVPFLYFATYHSFMPVVWHYSTTLLISVLGSALFFWLMIRSYRWRLPSIVTRLRSAFVLVGFWLIGGFLGLEFLLGAIDERPDVETVRLRGSQPDPELGYVYKPSYEQDVVFLEGAVQWRTNSIGVRANQEYGPKPQGVVRILALGDSFTVALRVAREDAWPAVLERQLNAQAQAGTTFEVINAGHAGWGTMQQSKWLARHGEALDLDAVVLAMTPNDLNDNGNEPPGGFTAVGGYLAVRTSTEAHRRRFEHLKNWYCLHGVLQRSYVWERIRKTAEWNWGQPELPAWPACRVELLDEEDLRLHELTEGFLLDMQSWTKARSVSFGIVLLTFREQLSEMAPGYAPEAYGERWAGFGAQHGIPVIDTFEDIRSYPDSPALFWRWDNHYSEIGSKIAGDAAFELVQNSLLQR